MDKKKVLVLLVGIASFVLSFGYWIPTVMKFGKEHFLTGMGWVAGFSTTLLESGSFGVRYGLFDFIFPSARTMIDQPIGIGIFLSVCLLVSFFFLFDFYKREHYIPNVFKLSLIWFLLTLLGTLGNYFPVNFVPHRFWVFLAIPFVMLSMYSVYRFTEIFKKFKWPIIIIALVLMFWTSGMVKYQVQTSQWGSGSSFGPELPDQQVNALLYQEELQGYLSLSQIIPKGSSIMELCWDEEKIRTFGYYAPSLDEEIMRFRENVIEHSAQEISVFAKKKNFEYILLTGTCLRNYSPDEMNTFFDSIQLSKLFEPIYATKAFFLFKVI